MTASIARNFLARLTLSAALLGVAMPLAAGDTFVLEVYPAGEDAPPMVFEASRSNVVQVAEGYMVQGDVQFGFGGEKLTLASAGLFFQYGEGTDRLDRVRGTAYVPSPYVSDNVVIKKPAMAELGLDYGANLDLGVPLNDERAYLFFRFDAGFEMEIGVTGDAEDVKPLTIEIPAGVKAMLILDPRDPFFFFSGELLTPEGGSDNKDGDGDTDGEGDADAGPDQGESSDQDSQPDDASKADDQDAENNDDESSGDDLVTEPGFGVSAQSLIPFRPRIVYGIEDVAREFHGDRIVTGEVQLGQLPLVVKGQVIFGSGFTEDATLLERFFTPVTQSGANGELELGYEFLRVSKLGNIAEISIPLGEATAAVEVVDELQYAYLSGKIAPDTSWIPDWVPVVPEQEMKAYGYISTDTASSRLAIESLYAVDLTNLGRLAQVDLGSGIQIEGAMKIDQSGFLVKGLTDADLGPFLFDAGATAEVFFPFEDPDLAYAVITGRVRVGGVATDGVMRISKAGVMLNGRIVNDQFELQAQMRLAKNNGVPVLAGEIAVPAELNDALSGSILAEVQRQRQATQSLLEAYQQATNDYEVEVSLRGMRKIIPGMCDGIVDGIDDGISGAFEKWPKKWGVSVPGKSAARSSANSQAEPHRRRWRALKSAAQKGDNETFRAALKSAIDDVLRNQRVKIKVSVIGTIYDRDVVSSTNESRLRTALAAIGSLPEASSRRIAAKEAWEAAPVNEALEEAFQAIESGVAAAPRFQALGIYHELRSAKWTLVAYLSYKGEQTVFEAPYDPENPQATVDAIAAAFIPTL
jgi:hypothetical protein